jgi:hypothetical protein
MIRILIAIVAVIVGLVVGMAANKGFVIINLQMFPLPEGVTWTDEEEIKAWLATLPQSAFILVFIAHLSQAYLGGVVAALIAKQNMMSVALTVGFLSMIGGIMNMMTIPAPAWLWVEVPLYLVVAWLAAKLVMKQRSACAA